MDNLSQPDFEGSVRSPLTLEKGTLESFGTPKSLEYDFKGQNTSHWDVFYTVGKVLKCRCPKWPRMSHLDIIQGHFGHLKHKLWLKEGPRVKLTVWLSTTKSRKSTRSWCVQVECNTPLKNSQRELQVFFRPHPNRRLEREVMNAQNPGSPNRDSFGTPLWESRDKESFECGCSGVTQRILYGGRWWLPLSPGRGELSESVLPVTCPNTKSVPNVN
jgi:hypothetical protein